MVILRQFDEKPQRVPGIREFANRHGKAGEYGLSVAQRGSGRQLHMFSFEAEDRRDTKSSFVVVSTVPFWFGPDYSIVAQNHSLLLSDRLSSVQLNTIQMSGTDLVVLRVTMPIQVPGSNFVLLGRPPASGASGPNTMVPLIDP